ncbi:RelA/SpoT family protein [Candidatus Phycosocius spiralis]|uniref:GTP pyrophosphokinase rsh n=1 Tax=Candidatus Phycosocius spiralis TaxID=2815099 RepID=A0ABQ4PS51_9PROT|nr:bifunctional (p)ppGpp synthetase/guanosine-3',5'-bis(diphosphate) 3'-pyrophosphohydrolase [Candidatus Phycosocius spiralis]GIU65857.1 guanosine-3',5'-bis(diphosphate) 3'-pyrophosphohydrolase [Candidatus Phycosocius spiralis]
MGDDTSTPTIDQSRELPFPEHIVRPPSRGRILRQYELVDRIRAYDPDVDEDAINRAYVFAMQRHGSQLRASGDPYFAHPIEVAGILTELRLDSASIITGLLHDTIEDTTATSSEIEHLFGHEVAQLVDGVTKLSQLELNSNRTKQAENLQKFILALSKDVRVLLVKLADRLHNMRTLNYIKKREKRERIARETADIYAPLARRMGIQRFSGELEELAFEHLHPQAAKTIHEQLTNLRVQRADAVATVTQKISAALEASGIEAMVVGREKRAYSIWKKLERKSISFSEVTDLYGFRVVVDRVSDCYAALGVIHEAWSCVPNRFKDFISVPKPNGYRSIHTGIVGPNATSVDIQIRTHDMNRIAEDGVAAHWRYKNSSYGYHPLEENGSDPLAPLRSLVEILEHGGDPEEFLENAKLEMFQDQVFAFTPKGDLIVLPYGATPLDFAYAVHTRIGDTTVGARINGEERPLRTALTNGDVVEILRSDRRRPVADWESVAVTGKARSAIRRLVRESEREEFTTLGKRLAGHALRRVGVNPDEVNLEDALQRLKYESLDELYAAIGRGRLTGAVLAEAAVPGFVHKSVLGEPRLMIDDDHAGDFVRGSDLRPGVGLHFMACCSPLPGDRIVGVHMPDRGVEVHTIDCEHLAEHETNEDQWIDLAWSDEAKRNGLALGRLILSCENSKGVFAQVGKIISECDGNITNVRAQNRREDFIDLLVDVEVADSKHLNIIAASLRALPVVIDVKRLRG